jgi:class 3 adenylate cyclase
MDRLEWFDRLYQKNPKPTSVSRISGHDYRIIVVVENQQGNDTEEMETGEAGAVRYAIINDSHRRSVQARFVSETTRSAIVFSEMALVNPSGPISTELTAYRKSSVQDPPIPFEDLVEITVSKGNRPQETFLTKVTTEVESSGNQTKIREHPPLTNTVWIKKSVSDTHDIIDLTDGPGDLVRSQFEESPPEISDATANRKQTDRLANLPRDWDADLISATAEVRTPSFMDWAGAPSTTIALLFTDVVASTDLGIRVGNETMSKIRRAHFNKGRELVERYGGYQIKTIGDSLMVAFRTAIDALNFQLDFRADTGHEQIKIRAGIHVGLIHVEDEDAFGSMVNFAARVITFAEGPEIWLSSSAKDHIDQEKSERHVNLQWHEHAGCKLKGFDGQHTLWSDKEPG